MTKAAALSLLAVTLVASSACARDTAQPASREFELGELRVQATVPAGWEALDQGAQKRFRKGESEIVLQNLGKADWDKALKELSDDIRRDLKSRREISVDGNDAVDIETWNRLDHTWPQRLLFVRIGEDVLALHTPRLADEATAAAFETIRDSLHFRASVRR